MMRLMCLFILAYFAASASFGDVPKSLDWPQWQGRDRDGMSREVGLLQEWPAEGPPIAWRVDGLGGGDSAPSIADGRIFGMSNRGDEEVAWALSESDGKDPGPKRPRPKPPRLPPGPSGSSSAGGSATAGGWCFQITSPVILPRATSVASLAPGVQISLSPSTSGDSR